MSGQGGFVVDSGEEAALLSTAGPNTEPQVPGGKKTQDGNDVAAKEEVTDEEEEHKMISSAHLEPSTLPWPGDQDKIIPLDLDKGVSGVGEMETGISRGSQDLSEEESDLRNKTKWRESMPEGERWRDDEVELQRGDKGDGSLADDEEEEEEDDDNGEWISEKSALDFTPHVKIVCPSAKEFPEEDGNYREKEVETELQMEPNAALQFYPEWEEQDDKYYLCEHVCSEKVGLILATVAAGLLFPLLVWGGYAWLPFDSPLLQSPPLRLIYTLRCSFFAMIPILLGVVVQGVARLRYSSLKPLHQGNLVNKEVAVHWHYVNDSLALFLFYFLQLAVMATYISQDLVKLVPLLTIIFVFGRLIYWICLSLDSSVRGFGFGLSFFPILVMLGTNLYFVCSSLGQGSVFHVAPPTTAPPPRMRWWI
ncbi:transmembrane protein 79-like [Cololabis saira]|uniref:transmembrane protein 79-like n=1 Tax=Cololabis saira TaxID=129043 RepID=UPI002AD453BE|nr:transmembrane protein 79-like [Cololabis saira]